jgi:DNA-binding MarR family transcriptional regulator/GNAT superfamily N-acetyltransferase
MSTMVSTPAPVFEQRVGAVRRFSRFYTRRIGLLQDGLLETPFSLTQARVLYEIAHRPDCTATDIVTALGVDHGYLSRILRSFEERGLITRKRARQDGRQMVLALTAKGQLAFGALDKRSQRDIGAMLAGLSESEQERVVAAMGTIETLIAGEPGVSARRYTLRAHRPGDMGWIVAKHGELYAGEYGWNHTIEAITADIVSGFLKNCDAKRERCWIAEMDGEPVGSVFLVRESDDVARIRLLIVDPRARGLGIGRDLVERSIGFAREAGYRRITLWTHAVLTAARAIYEREGFKLTRQWVHEDFGKPVDSETWELSL